jgi:hypothetical protein
LWATWDSQLLAIVGGTFAGEWDGPTTRLVINDITNGAPTLTLPAAGIANGGTALYSRNFATLWRAPQNVLTVLDVNVWDDSYGGVDNGNAFGTNVANWLAAGPGVPEPCGLLLALLGCVGMAMNPRRRPSRDVHNRPARRM